MWHTVSKVVLSDHCFLALTVLSLGWTFLSSQQKMETLIAPSAEVLDSQGVLSLPTWP